MATALTQYKIVRVPLEFNPSKHFKDIDISFLHGWQPLLAAQHYKDAREMCNIIFRKYKQDDEVFTNADLQARLPYMVEPEVVPAIMRGAIGEYCSRSGETRFSVTPQILPFLATNGRGPALYEHAVSLTLQPVMLDGHLYFIEQTGTAYKVE